MLAIGVAVVAGGAFYAGARSYRQLRRWKRSPWLRVQRKRRRRPAIFIAQQPNIEQAALPVHAERTARDFLVSSFSLGMSTIGAAASPLLSVCSVPLSLYVFLPTYQDAYRAIRRERRVRLVVVEATFVTVCVVTGAFVAAALYAWLHSLSEKLVTNAEMNLRQSIIDEFGPAQQTLWQVIDGVEVATNHAALDVDDVVAVSAAEVIPAHGVIVAGGAWIDQRLTTGESRLVYKQVGDAVFPSTVVYTGLIHVQLNQRPVDPLLPQISAALEQVSHSQPFIQRLGTAGSDRIAPWVLGASVLVLPLMGPTVAASSFLAANLGGQMHILGPVALNRLLEQAVRNGILIKDNRAPELLLLVNTIVIDANILARPDAREEVQTVLRELRQRNWPTGELILYLMSSGDTAAAQALTTQFGFDDYFANASPWTKANIIERLQMSRRFVCYVGDGLSDTIAMNEAMVSISVCSATTVKADAAQIVLVDRDLAALPALFDLAMRFSGSLGFSYLTPFALDLINVASSLFIHWGLVSSILLNYSGLLAGAIHAQLYLSGERRDRADKAPHHKQLPAPVRHT